jgi:hypothetical protein
LLRFWWVDRPEEVKNYLRARVQCHAKEAVDILYLFPQATVLGFESLTKMIDIEVLAAALEKHCGVALANREWSNELSIVYAFLDHVSVTRRQIEKPNST